MIARGVLVEKFENQISSYLGVSGSVATSSGTSALVLALQSLDVRKGSEIILPTYVCRSVLEAVLTVGAVPIICDVGPGWVMTSENIEPHLSSKTFGIPVDISCFVEFGLPVIEDACQAFGLHIDNKPAGSLGTIGVFSFHATKCLTTGEGGMLASNDRELLVKAKGIRDGNKVPSPRVPSPLSDLQAALGISQLKVC
jgi:UDP-4-amino-4-deoxy-L-arabinose-oxoglutarate aminotransferase